MQEYIHCMANIEGLSGKSNSWSEKPIHVQLAVASIIEEDFLTILGYRYTSAQI
jgi:hypothetical protein